MLVHAIEVIECVFERRIRGQITVSDMQYGLGPGKETTGTIFTIYNGVNAREI